MFKNLSKIVLITAILIFAVPRSASAVSWFPLVPCGLNQQPVGIDKSVHDYTQTCNQCLLIKLGKNIIDMTFFAIVPSVGTLMFLIAGFIILFNARSGKSDGVAKGRQIMKDTAIGIAIILGAWLITNFILKSIASDQVLKTPWYQIQCTTGTLKDIVDATTPIGGGAVTKYKCNTSNICEANSTGEYTTNTCDGKCQAPTGGVLVVAIASLPDATQGTAYSQTLSATGGVTPYIWSISSGALSAGISISGNIISGTPTAAGTATFTVKVEDSASPKQSATKQLTIKVNPTTGSLCSQPAQLAASNNEPYPRKNAPELDNLLSCIRSKLPGENLGSQFTYDNSYELCNYTRGQRTCTAKCSHAVNSCHYGGKTGSQGSLAVDFGNDAIGDSIIQAAVSCGVPSAKARCENAAGARVNCVGGGATHVHISALSCDAK
ncbi:MAG: putative Ig domain-containing protein [Patescibacteria group bacterium]